MDLNELMIGDWVYFKHYNGELEPMKIDNIYGSEFNCRTEHNYFEQEIIKSGWYLRDAVPIPITEDILIKNGFGYIEKDEHITHLYPGEDGFCADMDIQIGTYNDGRFWLIRGNNEVYGLEYVHHLQHALKLFNIKDTIKVG